MKFKLISFLLNAPDENPRGSGRPTPFHAPPKPGELTQLTTGLREATAEKNDPAISLLETLHAVKDKQHGTHTPSTADRTIDDISGVQSERSAIQRLLSTQFIVFGLVGLVLVLSIWGMILLARKAAEGVSPASIEAKNQRSTENSAPPSQEATQKSSEPPPAALPPQPLSRPQFRTESFGVTAPKGPSASQIQAEKERLAREERERQDREKQREEEEKQERERQLRELEGAGQNADGASTENAPPNGAEVAAPMPEDPSNQAPVNE